MRSLQHVAGANFVLSSGYDTHIRNYLFFGDEGKTRHLRDGSIEVADGEKLLFRVYWAKSYWKETGAFWYDAVIDQNGHILDIVMHSVWPAGNKCMSREELIQRSYLDLSRVSSREVCVE